MKTFKISEFSAYISVLNSVKNESLKNELKRQNGVLETLEDVPADKRNALRLSCRLVRLESLKAQINSAYKKEVENYLINCDEFTEKQTAVLNKAVASYAESKEDALTFVSWVLDNDILSKTPILDTERRLLSYLDTLYKEYIKGKTKANEEKTRKEREAQEAEKAMQTLLSSNVDVLKLLREKLEKKD